MRGLLLVLGWLAAAAGGADDAQLRAGVFEPARAAPDFSLRGSDATELKLSRYRGKVVILGFGFSSCSDVCPVTLAVLAEARRKLGAEGSDLQVIYVTVDPETDDAKRLRAYLAAFDPTFVGGTGEAEQLAAVRESYGVFAKAREGESGFSHSSYTYLIDREGKLRALMPFGHDSDDYVHDVRILLKQ
jgi:protein SCO1/2